MRSIQAKLRIVIGLMMLVVIGAFGIIASGMSRSNIDINSDRIILLSAENLADKLKHQISVSGDDTEALKNVVSSNSVYGEHDAFLITEDGDVIYHEKYTDGILKKDLPEEDRKFFDHVLSIERGVINKKQQMITDELGKLAVMDVGNGMVLGIAVPRRLIAGPSNMLIGRLFIISLFIMFIAIIIGFWSVQSIIGPLKKMTVVADHYANGDYSEKMEVERKDEVGILSRSLQSMSESLVHQIEIADSANKAKSVFLSNMSHEIRTPINAVLGFNEMILRESNDRDILMYSENIKNSGHTLLGLINDILDFSKIEAGKIEIIPVEYNLSSVINDLVNMIRVRSQEKGLGLTLDFDRDIPTLLYGDEIRIKQIITNILTNAVKYTEKGYITFTIGYDRIESEPDSVMMNVSVKDTGIGIREEDMKKLFTEFERIDEKRNRTIEGTGLGMNITQSLLDMMGSTLKVESIYGVGSVFSFSLKQKVVKWEPLGDYRVSFEQEAKGKEHYRSKFTAKDARVLMVDDNATNLLVFENLLKQTLVQVDSVTSGDECLNLCSRNKYDIIFLDHMMPGKDGIETLHEMYKDANSPNLDTPVICLTANAISGAREEYIKEGFKDYLTKPIDPDKLEAMMMEYLPEEKCEKNTVEKEDDAKGTASGNELDLLAEQDLIDIYSGIEHCINKDVYFKVLGSYYESIDETMKELNGFLAEEDAHNYVIRIHALKSTSKMIGANDLGKKAELLEMAGQKEDFVYLHDNHRAFMEEYAKVRDELGRVFDR